MKSERVDVYDDATRRSFLSFLDRVGTTGVVIFALTIGVGVWGWLAYVVASNQDFPAFTIVFLGANLVGAAAQMILFIVARPAVKETGGVGGTAALGGTAGSSVVFWGPTLVFAVVFLVITPPNTSGAGFDPDMNIYQVMALVVALGLLATMLGSIVLFCLIVLPLGWVVGGIAQGKREARDREYDQISGTEYVCAGLIVFAAVGFAVSLQFVAPAASRGSGNQRMFDQLLAFVTLQGVPVASVLAVLCVVLIVVLVIVSNRATAKRARLLRAQRIRGSVHEA